MRPDAKSRQHFCRGIECFGDERVYLRVVSNRSSERCLFVVLTVCLVLGHKAAFSRRRPSCFWEEGLRLAGGPFKPTQRKSEREVGFEVVAGRLPRETGAHDWAPRGWSANP